MSGPRTSRRRSHPPYSGRMMERQRLYQVRVKMKMHFGRRTRWGAQSKFWDSCKSQRYVAHGWLLLNLVEICLGSAFPPTARKWHRKWCTPCVFVVHSMWWHIPPLRTRAVPTVTFRLLATPPPDWLRCIAFCLVQS